MSSNSPGRDSDNSGEDLPPDPPGDDTDEETDMPNHRVDSSAPEVQNNGNAYAAVPPGASLPVRNATAVTRTSDGQSIIPNENLAALVNFMRAARFTKRVTYADVQRRRTRRAFLIASPAR